MGHNCLICETRKTQGYRLLHSFICHTCEQKIVQSEAGTEDYSLYVQKMRKMIAGN
ncbi:sigma factor G inhibitor Gin [Bacillus gibsonii]|nr:sigma factor G inhibitor Gin [Alkalicoccobacillus gibsonii]